MTYLIAGYNTSSKAQKQKYDTEKLVRYVGNFLINSGIILILGGIFSIIFSTHKEIIIFASWTIFTIYMFIWIIYVNMTGSVMKNINPSTKFINIQLFLKE